MEMNRDARFADVSLGEYISLHEQRLLAHFFWMGIIVVATGTWAASAREKTLVLSMGGLAMLIAMVITMRQGNRAAALYKQGFAYHDGKHTWSFRWEDLQRLQVHQSYDGDLGVSQEYVVIGSGESKEIPHSLARFRRLWETICLEAALAAGREGRAPKFGPFTRDAERLIISEAERPNESWRQGIPWGEIRSVDIRSKLFPTQAVIQTSEGELRVPLRGGLARDLIPDQDAFLRLCRHLIRTQGVIS